MYKKSMRKTQSIGAAILGNLAEYYDYALYGFLARQIGHHFFPASTPSLELLQSFGVFALGSFAKPLGALVFSHMGDRRGRQHALRWSMLGIAFPTLLIGLLPGYEEWGFYSPLALILCRLTQGFFVGGESDGVRIYVMEHIGRKRYCFANALTGVTAYMGIYIASALCAFVGEGLHWSTLFLGGGGIGIIIFLLRRHLGETPDFAHAVASSDPQPALWSILRQHSRIFCAVILLTGSNGGLYHFLIVFMNSYLSGSLGLLTASETSALISDTLLWYTGGFLLGGFAGDMMSKMKVILLGGVATLLLSVLVLWGMHGNGTFVVPFMALGAALGFMATPIYPMLMSHVQTRSRYRVLGIAHPIGSMALSGTAPFIATALWNQTQLPASPLIYFYGLLGITGVGLMLVGEGRRLKNGAAGED